MFKNPVLNAISRKSSTQLKQISRYFYAVAAQPNDYLKYPPILCNSVPKSGTHLLLQILAAFPNIKNFGIFIASFGSPLTFRAVPIIKIQQKLDKFLPGEIATAHLFYNSSYSEILSIKNVAHYFIYRDPRDVAVSEAYDITYRSRWHRLHNYFKSLPTMEERISFSIKGALDPNFPYDFPNIAQRFQVYQPWLQDKNVFSVRFEDLVSANRESIIEQMVKFYLAKTTQQFDLPIAVNLALSAIDPQKSHTFREGQVGGWQGQLSQQQKVDCMEVAGDLLIELGYESEKNWLN